MAASSIFQVGLALAALLGFAGTLAAVWDTGGKKTLLEPRIWPATRSTIGSGAQASSGIGAIGIVEPSSEEIRIGTHLSGIVEAVYVSPGARVVTGEALFVVDQQMSKANVQQRRADVKVAEARLKLAQARAVGLLSAV